MEDGLKCKECGRPVDSEGVTVDAQHCQECTYYSDSPFDCEACNFKSCDCSC